MFAILCLTGIYFASFINDAYAYLDPATGSILLSSMFAIASTAYFLLRNTYYKIYGFIARLFGAKIEQQSKYGIVFYSEGAQYWNTFKPVIEELVKRGEPCVYLTSGENDQGLQFESELVTKKYIGEGNTAFRILNMIEAEVMAVTTPNLNVLQLKRSQGVKHYTHIVHACADVTNYKMFAFDEFDSVMVANKYQAESIRKLENKRNTKVKEIYEVGLPYADVLKEKVESVSDRVAKPTEIKNILIAPTWGFNNLLRLFGTDFIEQLLKSNYNVTIRPHPQSYINADDKEIIETATAKLQSYPNLSWDNNPDNFDSLLNNDILISGMSGIVFDYACVFEKPVITLQFEPNWIGKEGHFLDRSWELEEVDKVGKNIPASEIVNIGNIINDIDMNEFYQQMTNLRQIIFKNYGDVATHTADNLIAIRQGN